MERTVSTHLDFGLGAPAKLIFAIAAAQGSPFQRESLVINVDGQQLQPAELVDVTGNRLHVLQASGSQVVLDYEAVIDGQAAPAPVDEFDLITYPRPSRYCESDTLGPTAVSEFGGLAVPVVVLTGGSTKSNVLSAWSVGASGFRSAAIVSAAGGASTWSMM